MNEFVLLVGELLPMRNSLILIGSTLRTRSAIDADRVPPVDELVHEALAIRSPLKAAAPEVTANVALTLSPGATGPGRVSDVSEPPATTAVHCASGRDRLSLTSVTGAPVVFVNVTMVSWVEPGANVWRPGGPAGAVEATRTVPLRPWPDESSTASPLVSSNR